MTIVYPIDKKSLDEQRAATEAALAAIQKQATALRSIKVHCNSCSHFGPHRTCTLWDARPPEEVLPVGCDSWIYDEIPF